MPRPLTYILSALLLLLALGTLIFGPRLWPPQVVVRWSTASEVNTAGFLITRAETEDGPFLPASVLIPARGNEVNGADYEFVDRHVEPGQQYYYQLMEVSPTGSTTPAGDVVSVRASDGRPLRWLTALLLVVAAGVLLRSGRGAALPPEAADA